METPSPSGSYPDKLSLSPQVRKLFQRSQKGNKRFVREALDFHYEDLVRRKTGGFSQTINGREIDSVTEMALIETKRSYQAITDPNRFQISP